MEDICKKNYAGFLEKMLEALVELPIEGLCVIGKMKGGRNLCQLLQVIHGGQNPVCWTYSAGCNPGYAEGKQT